MFVLEQLENDIEPFFNQTILKKYYGNAIKHKELLKVLYDEWRVTGEEELFLILYVQTWLCLESVYIKDIEKYYKENTYEKRLFSELLNYDKEEYVELMVRGCTL